MNPSPLRMGLIASVALATLSGCSKPLDLDLRSLGRGFDTSDALSDLPPRPEPDARGVISYPTYQVAVARKGDSLTSLAQRIGLAPAALARYNGIKVNSQLREGELVALPSRVAASPARAVSVTPLDSDPQDAPAAPEPTRHKVRGGETAYTVARLYNVPVQALAQWNGLGPDLSVREGQYLLIPEAGRSAPPATRVSAVTEPGAGSPTPTPPSAVAPLPTSSPKPVSEASQAKPPAPKPDIATTPAVAAPAGKLVKPLSGPIIRAYSRGRNDGIDIGASAGAPVKAADSGTVAAVTENTNGAQIVVVKHAGNLLTVYVNVTGLTVSKGATVARGQTIAKVANGDPSFLHFEVRKGLESVNPADYL